MAGPAPAVAAARTAVRRALADLPPGARVLVACSGGADSLALAAATAFVAPRAGLLAGAVSIDHGLQAASAAVAGRAAHTCREMGLAPVVVARVDVDGDGGPEAAARTSRYRALRTIAEQERAAAVLLGHTLDDQAETVLLGLARGSGARSLAGMAPAAGMWRRPFLALRRTETEACCTALGLAWVDDPTNEPEGPWRRADGGPLRRTAVRHHALPALTEALGPGVPEALARTADRLREDEDFLARAAAELGTRAGLPAHDGTRADRVPGGSAPDLVPEAPAAGPAPGEPAPDPAPEAPAADPAAVDPGTGCPAQTPGHTAVVLDVAVLAAAHPALRGRVLHRAAVLAGCPPGALARVHVEQLDALVADYRGQGPSALPGGVSARRECGRLIVG